MDKNFLNNLRKMLEERNSLATIEAELKSAQEQLAYLETLNEESLNEFDGRHKESYIFANAGPEPREPLFFFKEKWKREHTQWEANRNDAAEWYYKAYEQERSDLAMDRIYERRAYALQKVQQLLGSYNCISENIKSGRLALGLNSSDCENLTGLIRIFEAGRADSLKEARNVLCADLYQQKIESSLSEIKSTLNDLLEDISDIENRLDSLENYVDDLDSRISDIESEQDNDDCDDDEYDNEDDE